MTGWRQLKIAVLAGGPSCEREVSLISGKAVFDALREQGFCVELLDPAGDFVSILKAKNIRFVFLTLHGTFGEDGTIQRILDQAGIDYTGSNPQASELAFDKSRAQAIFQKKGLSVPAFELAVRSRAPKFPSKFPCVVKPATSGSSVGITIVFGAAQWQAALDEAFRYSDTVLIEEYIQGRELTVSILGDQTLPVIEVIPQQKFYDYRAKYQDSGTRYEVPAKLLEPEIAALSKSALDAKRALGCSVMARADFILSRQGKPYLLEVNTIPGLTGKSLLPKAANAAGIDFAALCVKILDLSWEARSSRLRRRSLST